MPRERVILWSAAVGEGCFWLLIASLLAVWLGVPLRPEPWLPMLYALLPTVLVELLHWQQGRGFHHRAWAFATNLVPLLLFSAVFLQSSHGLLAAVPYISGLYQVIRRSNLLEQITADGLSANWRWQLPFLFVGLLFLPGQPQTVALIAVYFLAWVSLTLIKTTASWRLSAGVLLLIILVLLLSTMSLNHSAVILWPFRALWVVFTQLLLLVVWPFILLLDPVVRWLSSTMGRQQPQQNPMANLLRPEDLWPEATQQVLREPPAFAVLKVLAGAAVVVLLIWLLWRSHRVRDQQGMGEPIEREALKGWKDLFARPRSSFGTIGEPQHALQKLYRQLQCFGGRQGLPRQSHVTPRAYQKQLMGQRPETTEDVGRITEAYMAWRYGDQDPDDQVLVRATEAAQRLAQQTAADQKSAAGRGRPRKRR